MSAVTGPFQLLPPLTDDEYAALKADIAERGVLVPVEFDEWGTVLDGHHRLQACEELGITDYPRTTRVGLTEDEKRVHVLTLNLARRHLTSEQRITVEAELRRQGWSYRRIAEVAGVSPQTVMRDVEPIVPDGTIPERVERKGGGTYPARRPAITTYTKRDADRAQAAVSALKPDDLPAKQVDLKRAERIAREKAAEERRLEPVDVTATDSDSQLVIGDFRLLGLGADTVDLIFTDPPYPREFLHLWSDLAVFADRVLTDTGMLVAYSGQFHLPEVLDRMREHLRYVWCGSLVTFGAHNNVQAVHVRSRAKPLLFFAKQDWKPDAWFDDAFESERRDKAAHDWQQSVGAARYYIDTLTPPGGLVVDPFLGSGTTAVAAKELGRRFIGCDVDAAAVASAQERVA